MTRVAIPGGPTGAYSYACDGTTPGSPVLSDGHALYTPGLSENRGGVSTYAAYDKLGNLWFMDGAGASTPQTFYQDTTAFGSGQNMGIGGTEAGPFKFGGGNGCQTDADTGLVLMGHRYYDTRIGRFITQDPAGAGGNWYRYAGNNPTNHVDPTGLYIENPEPVTDQTQGNLLFAQAFYGDRSGFSNFLDQESQSEQRGLAQFDAQDAINHALIMDTSLDPKPGTFVNIVRGLLEEIAMSPIGVSILSQFGDGKALTIQYYHNPADPNDLYDPDQNTVFFDPALHVRVDTDSGLSDEPPVVLLEHELGHDITGLGDPPEFGNYGDPYSDYNNISVNENSFREYEGLPDRINHHGAKQPNGTIFDP